MSSALFRSLRSAWRWPARCGRHGPRGSPSRRRTNRHRLRHRARPGETRCARHHHHRRRARPLPARVQPDPDRRSSPLRSKAIGRCSSQCSSAPPPSRWTRASFALTRKAGLAVSGRRGRQRIHLAPRHAERSGPRSSRSPSVETPRSSARRSGASMTSLSVRRLEGRSERPRGRRRHSSVRRGGASDDHDSPLWLLPPAHSHAPANVPRHTSSCSFVSSRAYRHRAIGAASRRGGRRACGRRGAVLRRGSPCAARRRGLRGEPCVRSPCGAGSPRTRSARGQAARDERGDRAADGPGTTSTRVAVAAAAHQPLAGIGDARACRRRSRPRPARRAQASRAPRRRARPRCGR